MIRDLSVNFDSIDGLTHTLAVPTEGNNLPYNLSALFCELIKKSDANPNIIIQDLITVFDYNEEEAD